MHGARQKEQASPSPRRVVLSPPLGSLPVQRDAQRANRAASQSLGIVPGNATFGAFAHRRAMA
jgi:hypothetical protein